MKYSNAFEEESTDHIIFGSLGRIVRSYAIANGYRDFALELLRLVAMTNFTPTLDYSLLTFDADTFMEWLRYEHYWLFEE